MKTLLALSMLLFLNSCASFFVKEKTYRAEGQATLNSAEVTSAVKGLGGKLGIALSAMIVAAATGETDGPFLWRIEARGEEGVHESLTVHSIRVVTETTGRNEPFPAEHLGEAQPFQALKGRRNRGKTFAKFQLPGTLEVYPEVDGKITMIASVSVQAGGRSERRTINFEMEPQVGRTTETTFIPTEVIQSFGAEDPTEWTWPRRNNDPYDDAFWGQ